VCRFNLLLALTAELYNATAHSWNSLIQFGTLTLRNFASSATIQMELLCGLVSILAYGINYLEGLSAKI
jgi:hypothetical protein